MSSPASLVPMIKREGTHLLTAFLKLYRTACEMTPGYAAVHGEGDDASSRELCKGVSSDD